MSLYYLWSSCRLPLLMVSCTLEGFLKPSSQCSYVLFVFCNYSCIINVLNKFKHFLPLKNLFEFYCMILIRNALSYTELFPLQTYPVLIPEACTSNTNLGSRSLCWTRLWLIIWFWNIPFHHKASSITLQVLKAYSIMYFCFIWVGIQPLKVFIITYLHVL